MTVWVLHIAEEEALKQREYLELPFGDFPDFSLAKSEDAYKRMLAALHPDAPPESLNRMLDKSWRLYAAIHQEDIICVPLKSKPEAMLAEMTGAYSYRTGNGRDIHSIPVIWQEKRLWLVGKNKAAFENRGTALVEIADLAVRNAVRAKLPRGYNRFAKWKWLLALFFALGIIRRLMN